MLLLNYDLYDLYAVLTALRAAPQKEYNVQIIQTVLRLLTEPQADNTIEDNLVRRRLRAICNLDQKLFRWVYTDNVYTYGVKIVKDEFYYSFLANGFRMLLECAVHRDDQRLELLADALHNVPIYFAEGCKNFKKTVKPQFSRYDGIYKTNLHKDLSNQKAR